MNIFQSIVGAFRYFFGGIVEIFSPDHDNYPLIGVQPFDGEVYSKWLSSAENKYDPK